MKAVVINTENLSSKPLAFASSEQMSKPTRFADLQLPARLLLAVPRARGTASTATIPSRYVLDTLGRIIDGGNDREQTIASVNRLSEVLLRLESINERTDTDDPTWLSDAENLMLCVLCRIKAGDAGGAQKMVGHWLDSGEISTFNQAAGQLCDAACFKSGGQHVFSPSWNGVAPQSVTTRHRSVVRTGDLSLGESLLLNALRLRIRTLPYAGFNTEVVPLMGKHLALPGLAAVIDAVLVESLQYASDAPDIRCLCAKELSVGEARHLGAMAAFMSGDETLIKRQLSYWLPESSVERLSDRTQEFRETLNALGSAIPLRQWNFRELHDRRFLYQDCHHFSEPPMMLH